MNMNVPFQKVLVTGGAGFIGSHLVEALVKAGCEVTVLDDFNDFYDPAIKRGHLKAVSDQIQLQEGDIRDRSLLEKIFKKAQFEAVFHLAARAGVRPSIDDPRLYVSTNVDGTLNLLECCRMYGVKNFIFASSSSIYGVNKKVPFAEEDRIERTISPYAATKIMGEQLCSNYANLYGIRCVCLRFFTVFGPRQRPDLAIAKFSKMISSGKKIPQYGDGRTGRDYTYVKDIISGVMAAACWTGSDFEIFNLGGSETHSLVRLIEVIEAAVGRKALIDVLPEQPGDVPLTYADVRKAEELLDYRIETSLEEGVLKYVEWLRSEGQIGS